jgi:alkylation response protein AidB-like acyl-CoA dehydrogenase
LTDRRVVAQHPNQEGGRDMALVTPSNTLVWLEGARDAGTVVEDHREEGERERHLPDPTYEAMRDAGLYSLMLPRRYGGPQAGPDAALLVIEDIARRDGASGWNLMIGIQGSLFSEYLPGTGAEAVYGGGNTLVAGNFAPGGRAVPVTGGYRLGGHWSFASGCRHANWLICGALVIEDGAPRPGPDGSPAVHLMFIPASEATIIDAWHTGGLRGTGSNDFEAQDVFVPEDRCFALSQLALGPERNDAAYPQAFMALAGPQMAAVCLGIARDAIDSFKALAFQKTPSAAAGKLAGHSGVHEKVGLAEATLEASRSYLLERYAELCADPKPSDDLTARVRLASAYAARSAEEAVTLLYNLGGGTVIYNSSRLDRCFRDVHTASHHILLSPSNFEIVGRYLLGLGLQIRR